MIYKIKPDSKMVDEYMVPNPEYIKAVKLGLYLGGKPKKVFLGSVKGRAYPPSAPYLAKSMGVDGVICTGVEKEYTPHVSLRPHQAEVFADIKDFYSGLIELQTGAGKSILAAELAQYHGEKTLIVLHSVEMLKQFQEMYEEKYGIEAAVYGNGRKKIGDVTLTTFKSAVDKQEEFDGKFGTLIVDECDRFFTEKARHFICTFPARWKYGFTGTTNSAYGEGALELFWGKRVTADVNYENPVKHLFRSVYQDDDAPKDPQDWQKIRKYLYESKERLQHIMWDIHKTFEAGDYYLILMDRNDHVDWLHEALTGFEGPLWKTHGKMQNKDRDMNIEGFKTQGGILIAQYQTTGRGFDAPECNKIYLGFPTKDETNIRQIIGRASRHVEGKESTVYDLVDFNLWFQFRQRERIYKKFFGLTATPLPR